MNLKINTLGLVSVFVVLLISGSVYAATQIPYVNQINFIKNYNRATKFIATSGSIEEGGLPILRKFGFKTIIDLRTEEEGSDDERKAVAWAGMHYINIPVTGDGIDAQQLEAFTKAIKSAKPILVHCASGNRAGAMWASYQISQGVELEKAMKEGRKAGMLPALEEKVRMTILGK